MPGIVHYPQLVQRAMEAFGDLFYGKPQRRHFGEYLTGLFVALRKNVSGINREFAATTDPSCLNRFLTECDWDVTALNERRLELLQEDSSTRYSERGVIAIDNVLVDHDGKLIEDVGWFWDHAEKRNKIAHDYLFANYVCTSGKHYPLEFRRFKKRDQCEATGEEFESHTALCRQLIDWVCARNIPGDFTWDSYFSNAEIMNHTHGQKDHHGRARAYVGDLKRNRKLERKGSIQRVEELAAEIDPSDKKELRRGETRQWYLTFTCRIPKVNHKVRIVILWDKRQEKHPKKVLVTNRTTWEVIRILKTYRHRWTGTETFHRDGKQELGLGDCQLRNGEGHTRHMYLVMLAYSLLMSQLRQGRAQEWALHRLTTIGEACQAMLNETLRSTMAWAIAQVTDKSCGTDEVIARIGLA